MYYTKYRPQKFSEILKNNDAVEAISKQVIGQKTVHAYLFVGPRGTGKTTTARILAKAMNCENLSSNGDPCNKCVSCKAIQKGSYLDLIEIDAASNRGIDDIRDLKEKIRLAPSAGSYKVYIIDEVHMLTPEAFNALLKTLEEPPAKVMFILCTTEMHKVPETIRSRCQVFKFKRATIVQITERLRFIAEKEKANISDSDLKQIAAAAYGGFRDAETLLQQVIEGEIPADSLTSIGTYEQYASFYELLKAKKTKEAIKEINALYEKGTDLYVWSGELTKYLRDLMLLKVGAYDPMLDLTEETAATMKEQSKGSQGKDIVNTLELLLKAQNELKNSFIAQLPLEIFVVTATNSDSMDENWSDRPMYPKGPQEPKTDKILTKSKKQEDGKEKISVTSSKTDISTLEITKNEDITTVEYKSESVETVSLDTVSNNWKTIIKEVSDVNSSVSALLRSATLIDVEGKWIRVEVPFDFHKERLESNRNRKIVESALSSVLEKELTIKCDVKKQPRKKVSSKETGKLTDLNLVSSQVSKSESPEELMGMFDGALPM